MAEQTETRFGGASASPGFLRWRATLRWQRAIARALRAHDLTRTQFVLLASLWSMESHGDGPPTQRELARRTAIDVPTTGQVVRALEGRGLLERPADAHDARARRLALTPAGRAALGPALAAVESTDVDYFGDLIDDPALLGLLTRLAALDEE